MPTSNAQIAQIFEDMATLLEMKGDNIFKIRAYQRAARTIEQLPLPLEQSIGDGLDPRQIPGIGKAISDKIQEYLQTGRVAAHDRLVGELPDGVLTLLTIPGIGPKTAMVIAQDLGGTTIEGLEKAILEDKLAALPCLGQKAADNILRHLKALRTRKPDRTRVFAAGRQGHGP